MTVANYWNDHWRLETGYGCVMTQLPEGDAPMR